MRLSVLDPTTFLHLHDQTLPVTPVLICNDDFSFRLPIIVCYFNAPLFARLQSGPQRCVCRSIQPLNHSGACVSRACVSRACVSRACVSLACVCRACVSRSNQAWTHACFYIFPSWFYTSSSASAPFCFTVVTERRLFYR